LKTRLPLPIDLYPGEDRTVRISRSFKLLDDIVQAEDYPDFKQAMQKLVKADIAKRSISLQK